MVTVAGAGEKAIQNKLDRLDEPFLFDRSIDIETSDHHTEKLREALQLEELDVEGILAATRVFQNRCVAVC